MTAPDKLAKTLRDLAAPEARVLRRAYQLGTSGARISGAEAAVVYAQLDDEGRDLISRLRKLTEKRWADQKREAAAKKQLAEDRRAKRRRRR